MATLPTSRWQLKSLIISEDEFSIRAIVGGYEYEFTVKAGDVMRVNGEPIEFETEEDIS